MTKIRTSPAMAFLVLGVTALILGIAVPSANAQPSKAETDAVRSNCRSDYMAKCMSVKPGGIEAIQCLKKNDASLSPACRSAVAAIKLPGEAPPASAASTAPSPQPAPAATTPPAATSKPAEPASTIPTPTKPVPPKPVQATAPRPVVAAAPAAPAPVVTAPPVSAGPKLAPLQEAQLIRRFCTTDFQVLCKGVRLGQGRAINCLASNQPALSPGCKQAMATATR